MVSVLGVRQKTTAIGLDIGECGVRAVQLSRSGNSYQTARAVRAERDIAGGSPADREQWLERHVSNCVRQASFKGRSASVAVCQPDAEFHALDLPEAKPTELGEIVQNEVTRLLAGQYNRVETAYWRLPHTSIAAPNAIGVATPYEKVVGIVSLCRSAGLTCSRVDIAATALGRFGCTLNSFGADEVWGVLDLGHRQARLILCLGDVPVLVRTVGAGGAEHTTRIAEALGTSVQTAEVQKRDHGIALGARGMRQGSGGVPASELASVLHGILRTDLNALASEIKRSYEYVLSCYPGKHAADLILVGSAATMRNLSEHLGEVLGIPVACASAYLQGSSCRLRYASGKQNPLESSALAIGLAIGG
ncbi:MAG: pilus assembly protein PilM [Phycisphaerales bacterium]|nr:MAG: pilus assembly protein PilM [Phycisphaerales bacterium]